MAKVTLNPLIKEIRGAMGDVVFRVSPRGNTYISKRPDLSHVEWSEAQTAQRQRFREANAYAKAAMTNPRVRAVYEQKAKEQGKRPRDLAFSDYFQGIDLLVKE